eukprot:Partr_v1_DN28130_c0_g1_i3_m56176 putative intraflagellar transport 46 homolog (Chlamydomonas)
MTSNTRRRYDDDQALALQMRYEEELEQKRMQSQRPNHAEHFQVDQDEGSDSSISMGPPPVIHPGLSHDRQQSHEPPNVEYQNDNSNDDALFERRKSRYSDFVDDSPTQRQAEPPKIPPSASRTPRFTGRSASATRGITLIDEPSIESSDIALRQMQMRAKQQSAATVNPEEEVPAISSKSHDYNRALAKWCQSVLDIHGKLNPDRVFYSKRMPSIELLMSEWNTPLGFDSRSAEDTDEVWRQFKRKVMPEGGKMSFGGLKIPFGDLAKVACLLVDIPVYASETGATKQSRNLIESLHVLFSLYLEFKNSGHFGKMSTEQQKTSS